MRNTSGEKRERHFLNWPFYDLRRNMLEVEAVATVGESMGDMGI